MIHSFSEDFVFEEPRQFTDPFRYVPHPAVKEAAKRVIERIEADPDLATAFSEGKMLGVLVCRQHDTICYIAAFSGNVGGRSQIEGFVPPIYDLLSPDGEFKRREAEITALNHRIEELLDSDRHLCLERELSDALRGSSNELAAMKELLQVSKARREQIRKNCSDPDTLQNLIKESQYEKAEYRRLKKVLDGVICGIRKRIAEFHSEIESLKKQRAAMSESLQDWIFRQYIVHNALGESSSIADIFAASGLIPPGGTGECAAPKLLEYAYRNNLVPLAMGEFWYGQSPETAVRTHGHFYPSCTSKCGPLLAYMLRGMPKSEWPDDGEDMPPPARGCLNEVKAGVFGIIGHSDVEQTVQPIQIPEPITLYEDKAMIVVEKPSGMPSVPGLDGRISLEEWLGKSRNIHSVHRLDMDTSGIMVFAKTKEAEVHLKKQFEEHSVQKSYMARICGPLNFPTGNQRDGAGTIDLPLSPDYDERPRQKVDFKQGKLAHTEYKIISENQDGTADLLLYPHTGRTHQLRVHCAHTLGLGRPILGDLLYGAHSTSQENQPGRLCLHALSISFTHPLTGEEVTFTSKELCY